MVDLISTTPWSLSSSTIWMRYSIRFETILQNADSLDTAIIFNAWTALSSYRYSTLPSSYKNYWLCSYFLVLNVLPLLNLASLAILDSNKRLYRIQINLYLLRNRGDNILNVESRRKILDRHIPKGNSGMGSSTSRVSFFF